MTKLDLLQEYYAMACHSLSCFSKDYAMDKPIEGCEEMWGRYRVKCELLKEMIVDYLCENNRPI